MTTDRPVVLEARAVVKSYGSDATRVDALRGVDLVASAGEFVAVMGPSGSGKSTLLHLLGGLDIPTTGKILIDGRDPATLDDDALTLLRRERIGFVFQAFNLIGVLTVEENIALPLALAGTPDAEARRKARAALETVELSAKLSKYPGELSGGEQQRVAIARALVHDPRVLIADEPTGNLDTATSDHVMALLHGLVAARGQTILMVTHSARNAARADRVVTLRDGRIVDDNALSTGRSTRDVLAELEALS